MIRGLTLTVSFLLAGAVPVLAQTHARPHGQGHPHGPGHVRPDSATHAAMHARLHGSWTGTFKSHQGDSSAMDMSLAHDSLHKVILRMSRDGTQAGTASDVVMNGDKLSWTQDVSGTACKATAVLSSATPLVPEMMKGTMACEHGDITFTLHKKTG